MNPNHQLRSLFEAAQQLGDISYWTLYRGIDAGFIKAVRLGGRLMIAQSEIDHLAQYGFGPGKKTRKRRTAAESRADEDAGTGAVVTDKQKG